MPHSGAREADLQRIDVAGGLMKRSPLAAWALLLGGLAIAGAPPFALFVSEFEILRTGFSAHQYLATSLLTAFIVLAFVAVMYQLGQVVFGETTDAAAGTVSPAPLTCRLALLIAAVPVLVFGVYLPARLGELIRTAAVLMGGLP